MKGTELLKTAKADMFDKLCEIAADKDSDDANVVDTLIDFGIAVNMMTKNLQETE